MLSVKCKDTGICPVLVSSVINIVRCSQRFFHIFAIVLTAFTYSDVRKSISCLPCLVTKPKVVISVKITSKLSQGRTRLFLKYVWSNR